MKNEFITYRIAFLFLSLTLILASCGDGGGSAPGPPFIAAELNSFPTGSVHPGLVPSGFNSMASAVVIDDYSGASITDALVTINGAILTYNFTDQYYEGTLSVSPGESITLRVTVGGNSYTASGTQFTSYPTISGPVSGASWPAGMANSVIWSGGTPTIFAQYDLGVLDADTGQLIWPPDNFLQAVPIFITSYSIPEYSLTAGNRSVIVDIATDVGIPSAAPGSVLFIGGLNYIPITVTSPQILASSLNKPWGIAIDSASVYWTEINGGVVGKVGINGGTVTTIASGLNAPCGIAIDPTNVYWTDCEGGTVNKVGINGGAVTTLASGFNTPLGIAIDSINVYWTDYSGGTVNKVGINGGAVTTLASGLVSPSGITGDATSIYLTDRSTVEKVGINGGTVTNLARTIYPWGIAVDSNSVYWTDHGIGALYKVGINGGTVATLASGFNNPWGIAIDSTNVYWTDCERGTVKKVGINGGTITTLAAGLSCPTDIKVDATSVYWVEYDTAGSLKKIAK